MECLADVRSMIELACETEISFICGYIFNDLIGAIYCIWVARDTNMVALPEP
jgi:hypothetical protein